MPRVPLKNILLVGEPGSGKTTVLQKTMALLPRLRFGGFFVRTLEGGRTPARRAAAPPGHRQRPERRLVLVRGRSRELSERPLARTIEPSSLTVYDPTSFLEAALPCLEAARREADVVVLDELEDLEDAHQEAFAQVRSLFEQGPLVVATARNRARPWIDALATREDTLLIEVRGDNRAIVDRLLAVRLAQALNGSRAARAPQ
jgi:nucleoside-triphosphatase THEP1